MVYKMCHKEEFESENNGDISAEEIERKRKQEDQQKAERGKHPLSSLLEQRKVYQFPDRINGKQLPTQSVSSYPSSNRPKTPTQTPTLVGPYGRQVGVCWDDGSHSTVRQIVIMASNCVESIHIEYDDDDTSVWSQKHGGPGKFYEHEVHLDYPSEYVIAMSGFFSSESVQGLTFQTNRKTYGPFGKVEGKHFSTPSTGGKIVGFHGHCSPNLVSIGAYFEPIVFSDPAIQIPVSVGPFGGPEGGSFDDGIFTGIRGLTITSGTLVDSIIIEYDSSGCSVISPLHGGRGGTRTNTITLDYPDEFLISAWGHINEYGIVAVRSLTIQSNKKTYGPFGTEFGKKFSFPSIRGKIIGFHGKCDEYLYALGAYYESCQMKDKNTRLTSENFAMNGDVVGNCIEIPIFVGPFGGSTGSPWNDGVYTTIRQVVVVSNNDTGITSIQIEYDNYGNSEWSEKHGENAPYKINKVHLDYPSEFLIAMSGFFSSESVQGLTFQTNRKTYGPFGKVEGKHFSTPSTGGKIVGFHGLCGPNLVSIGAYFEPIVFSDPAIQKPVSVGPFGGPEGASFDDGIFTGIRGLTITSGTLVDSIIMEYDSSGCSVISTLHGGRGGTRTNTITLDYPDEFLISAWGHINEYGIVAVRSLTIQSNKKTYGPFGTEFGKKFSFPSTGGKIIGFHGKSGRYLDAIGAYLEPTTYSLSSTKIFARLEDASEKASSSNFVDGRLPMHCTVRYEPPEGFSRPTTHGPWGGTVGKTFDDGVFSGVRAVHITRNGALTSIRALYDQGGQPVWGSKNGGSFGIRLDKIEFDYPSEVLTNISGYYQSTIFMGPVAIASITFHTTKQTYGPFGTQEGIFFSSELGSGTIVGFLGRKELKSSAHLISPPLIRSLSAVFN